ncbi:MAG: hypothetical protein ACI4SG_04895 [Oligosphaeraceae bacterium]
MKKTLLLSLTLGLILPFAGQAAPKTRYDIRYNERRVQEITLEILKQVKVQEEAYKKKVEEFNKQGSAPGGAGMDPYGGPMGPGGGAQQQKPESLPPYKLDRDVIKAYVQKKYNCNEMDAVGPIPKVDVRNREDLQEEATREVKALPEYKNLDYQALREQEVKEAEAKYPLYKEGERVEISFAHGNEPSRTYRGTYKNGAGRSKIWIGRDMINKDDLPELIRARFDPELNARCRQREINAHKIIGKIELEMQEAIANRVKEKQQKQFEKNLPRGWVYVNDTWKMPSEMVDDTLDYRKDDLNRRNAPRPARDEVNVFPGRSN